MRMKFKSLRSASMLVTIAGVLILSLSGMDRSLSGPQDLTRAEDLYRQGHFDEAARIYAQIAGQDPASYRAALGMGRIYLLRNSVAEAETWLRKALELKPQEREPQALMGEALYRRDNYFGRRAFLRSPRAESQSGKAQGVQRPDALPDRERPGCLFPDLRRDRSSAPDQGHDQRPGGYVPDRYRRLGATCHAGVRREMRPQASIGRKHRGLCGRQDGADGQLDRRQRPPGGFFAPECADRPPPGAPRAFPGRRHRRHRRALSFPLHFGLPGRPIGSPAQYSVDVQERAGRFRDGRSGRRPLLAGRRPFRLCLGDGQRRRTVSLLRRYGHGRRRLRLPGICPEGS